MPLEFEKPILELERRIAELKETAKATGVDLEAEIRLLEERLARLRKETYENLTPWQRVQLARASGRPTTLDVLEKAFQDFIELHGDRAFADDPAIVGGLAYLEGEKVVVVGHQKGRDTKENLQRNFGMPHPEGYRKAMRLMDLADRFGYPFLTFVDTPGAYPGVSAEERGQAWVIAQSIQRMSRLRVPAVTVILGEGGSGGALAIAVANRVLILENAWYSVISPESCAAILWRDAKEAPKAAEALKLTAKDLLQLKVVDAIVPEPEGGAHKDPDRAIRNIKEALLKALEELKGLSPEALYEDRYRRFRSLGAFAEP
ncbi:MULTISPECIES: acetyl-CoA carboxylase carboxyltransferase subunit alpha [Thermus]|jgi:acetyl-CoA carboxylase carboxyl transferase subunit alpha|uniref:Acetyl-coenzyme A carboxylase carboxyl transferase subunit alpha n=1 Tax=Thermus thermophilus (strain ATCC 27634 / DSM 579 / HB8) TaxID=300852 RepID=ACCA_THET8|nr:MULTISPECIES: acetyl-CoA carboxylase carboxyltransferase subunit alpha [Thermus]Q5SHG3.1 RecName: Full=Acetyl-coenzyme A carboxylase carboxyl transferase subunit alpha; Short=ACCase subunit alpha; Short=Acetyl-CoA carboxylase carboxyltransferase subunit alpha [Thermus thermophilus HB8]QZY58337.1 acetyl-CoA carboxylase carboxyltransferase subunit alpha [Thermus thermophilus]BAD71590.1 acetyl-CoA carboxylase carboxyl transferase, alpha subunit (AccA) [Thermus thermophilus HB8]BDA38384.1 acetyl